MAEEYKKLLKKDKTSGHEKIQLSQALARAIWGYVLVMQEAGKNNDYPTFELARKTMKGLINKWHPSSKEVLSKNLQREYTYSEFPALAIAIMYQACTSVSSLVDSHDIFHVENLEKLYEAETNKLNQRISDLSPSSEKDANREFHFLQLEAVLAKQIYDPAHAKWNKEINSKEAVARRRDLALAYAPIFR